MKLTKYQQAIADRIKKIASSKEGQFAKGVPVGAAKGAGETLYSLYGAGEDIGNWIRKKMGKKSAGKAFPRNFGERFEAKKPGEGTGKTLEDLAEWTVAATAVGKLAKAGKLVPKAIKATKAAQKAIKAGEFIKGTGGWALQDYIKSKQRSLGKSVGGAAGGMAAWNTGAKIVKKIWKPAAVLGAVGVGAYKLGQWARNKNKNKK